MFPWVKVGEGTVKFWGAKTRDSGSGCQWKTAPQPLLKFGTNNPQNDSR